VFVCAEGQGFLGEGWKGRDVRLRNGRRGYRGRGNAKRAKDD